MQLKQRIKKIEAKLSSKLSGSVFCGCWKKHWQSELEAAYNKDPEIKIEIYPMPDFEKGFCERCQKEISADDAATFGNMAEIHG